MGDELATAADSVSSSPLPSSRSRHSLFTYHSSLVHRLVPELAPALVLIAAVVVLFRDAILGGQVFYEQDTELFYFPLTQWFGSQVQAGHLPLWLPHIFGGYPILADGEIGPLYPLQLPLLLLLDAAQAFTWLRVLHYCLAALFMYALLRVLGAGRLGGVVAGLVFAFGGFLATQMQHENVVRTSIWLPLVLLLVELALRARDANYQRYLAGGGLAMGVALLGLHVQPALMMAMALALYIAVRVLAELSTSWERGRLGPATETAALPASSPSGRTTAGPLLAMTARVGRLMLRGSWALGLVLGIAAALAAVQVIPLYELARTSFRGQGVGYEFASAFGIAPENLPSLLFPYFFRLPDGAWWTLWTPWETFLYAGVVPLVLAPLCLLRAPWRLSLYFILLGTLSLLVAMAHYGPFNLHELLWQLPGLSFLRAPGRFSYLFVFAVSGLAAFGADWLAAPARGRRSLSLVAAALLALLGVIVWLLQTWRGWLIQDPARARDYLEATYLALRRQSVQPTIDMVYQGLLWSLDVGNPKTLLSLGLLAGLGVLVAIRVGGWRLEVAWPPRSLSNLRNRKARTENPKSAIHLWPAALAGLVAIDLLVFAYDFHPRVSLQALTQPGPLLQALAQQGGGRVLAGPGVTALEPNRALAAGLDDLNGYSSLPSQRQFDYWSHAHTTPNFLLDLLGADWYAARSDPGGLQRESISFYPSQPLLSGPAGNPAGWEAFRLPDVEASEVLVVGSLSHALEVPEGSVVGEVQLIDTQGNVHRLPLRAGQDLAERAYDRSDVRPAVRHSRPRVLSTTDEWGVDGSLFPVNFYLARLTVGERLQIRRVVVRGLLEHGELNVFGLALARDQGSPVYSIRPTEREKLEPHGEVASATLFRDTRAFPRAFVVSRAVRLDPARRDIPVVQMLTSPFDPAREALLEYASLPLPPIGHTGAPAAEPGLPSAAQVEDVSTEQVRVQATLEEPGFVVLTDLYHRGWEARVDGQPASVYLADSLFRAVAVPAGQHVVDFTFNPLSLRLGAFLSLEALLFVGLLLCLPAVQRRLLAAKARMASASSRGRDPRLE